ncbi:MAG: phosphotransferase [Pseudomonadota bacterium]
MDERLEQLHRWLRALWGDLEVDVRPASEDASFRRYFRVSRPGEESLILMDAPPDKEGLGPFVDICARLDRAGLHVPRVIEKDQQQGFLLLTDLGRTPYLSALTPQNVDGLYRDALSALVEMQQITDLSGIPPYNEAQLRTEMDLFSDWFLPKHLGLDPVSYREDLAAVHNLLVANALAQPQVFVHRDYHSRNLMVCHPNPGILDFQDAMVGPVTYDLVSLLKDCYIQWGEAQIEDWVAGFLAAKQSRGQLAEVAMSDFREWFDLMGLQRHMKAIGIFSRLNYRDGKPQYLNDIPRTLDYVQRVAAQHQALLPLTELIESQVIPRLNKS